MLGADLREGYINCTFLTPELLVFSLKMTTRDIALTASMSALYVVLSRLPGFPVIGVEGAQIGLLSCVVPVFGFLLGPWLGAGAAFFGGFASRVLFGASPFTWLTLPTTASSAFAAGCLSRRSVGPLRGWLVAALALGGFIFAWYVTWVGQVVMLYLLLHWVALAIILIFRGWLAYFIQRAVGLELTVCVGLCSFIAVMTAHLYGTLAFVAAAELGVIGTPLDPVFFWGLIPVVAVERLLFTIIATVLGVPTLLALRRRFRYS